MAPFYGMCVPGFGLTEDRKMAENCI